MEFGGICLSDTVEVLTALRSWGADQCGWGCRALEGQAWGSRVGEWRGRCWSRAWPSTRPALARPARHGQIIAHNGWGEGLKRDATCEGLQHRGQLPWPKSHACISERTCYLFFVLLFRLGWRNFHPANQHRRPQPWRQNSLGLTLRMPPTRSYAQSGAWQSKFHIPLSCSTQPIIVSSSPKSQPAGPSAKGPVFL